MWVVRGGGGAGVGGAVGQTGMISHPMIRSICSHASPEKAASFLIAETTSYLIYPGLISIAEKEKAATRKERGGGGGCSEEKGTLFTYK